MFQIWRLRQNFDHKCMIAWVLCRLWHWFRRISVQKSLCNKETVQNVSKDGDARVVGGVEFIANGGGKIFLLFKNEGQRHFDKWKIRRYTWYPVDVALSSTVKSRRWFFDRNEIFLKTMFLTEQINKLQNCCNIPYIPYLLFH